MPLSKTDSLPVSVHLHLFIRDASTVLKGQLTNIRVVEVSKFCEGRSVKPDLVNLQRSRRAQQRRGAGARPSVDVINLNKAAISSDNLGFTHRSDH